jgi:hypothetical protein
MQRDIQQSALAAGEHFGHPLGRYFDELFAVEQADHTLVAGGNQGISVRQPGQTPGVTDALGHGHQLPALGLLGRPGLLRRGTVTCGRRGA